MPKWKKSSPELVARFETALPGDPRITPRKMFGYPASFLSEGFFAGLFEARVVVREPADVHAKTKTLAKAAAFHPMGGRPMEGWYSVGTLHARPVTTSRYSIVTGRCGSSDTPELRRCRRSCRRFLPSKDLLEAMGAFMEKREPPSPETRVVETLASSGAGEGDPQHRG